MKKFNKYILLLSAVLLPLAAGAQTVDNTVQGLHGILEHLYDEMIPLAGQLIGVARGLAGFAALFYIAARVWRHLANAEPIDFYPLFRPFALGFCIAIFPSVLGLINGVMKPTVTGTAAMVENSNKAVSVLLKQKEDALKKTNSWKMYIGQSETGDRDRWLKYTKGVDNSAATPDEGIFESIGNDVRFAIEKLSYKFTISVKEWMAAVLNVLFLAAGLCIDTLRTFQLIVLSIIGPLVFGLAVFDGLQHTLSAWLARYLNIFLWLPVANIFGAIISRIQEKMIELDIAQIGEKGNTFFSPTDIGYLIFMIIGIVGYFTVPTVASFVINSGSGGALEKKITNAATGGMISTVQRAGGAVSSIANIPADFDKGRNGQESGRGFSGAIGRALGRGSAYMADKLSGKKS